MANSPAPLLLAGVWWRHRDSGVPVEGEAVVILVDVAADADHVHLELLRIPVAPQLLLHRLATDGQAHGGLDPEHGRAVLDFGRRVLLADGRDDTAGNLVVLQGDKDA